jgi:hypothetical protein
VLGGRDYLDRLNAPTQWTKRVVPSFRHVARSICRVAYTLDIAIYRLEFTRLKTPSSPG